MRPRQTARPVAAVVVLSLLAIASAAAQQPDGMPAGEQALGSIELPRRVLANGEALAAGTYEVHLTSQAASPETLGAMPARERWVEFRQAGAVSGREVATLVPQAEIADVAKSAPPGNGASRVEVLRENEYLRVWINQGGTHYLIHLAVG